MNLDFSLVTQGIDLLPVATAAMGVAAAAVTRDITKLASEFSGYVTVRRNPTHDIVKVTPGVGLRGVFDNTDSKVCRRSDVNAVSQALRTTDRVEGPSDGHMLQTVGMISLAGAPLVFLNQLMSGASVEALGVLGVGGLLPVGAAMIWRSSTVQRSVDAFDRFLNRVFPDREHYEEIQAAHRAERAARKHK